MYLEASRADGKAAHGDEPPLVVDPFAGGGSIPLEALRVGCEAFASDLNPVACLILKVMLEDIPRHGPALAEELRKVGAEIKTTAEKELAEFYPPDPDGARPIAYLWARTVRCEAPNGGAEIPLMRSFWLCKKANRKRALRRKVVRNNGEAPRTEFEIFEPKTDKEVPDGTVTRAKATCLCCSSVLPPERVRAQLAGQKGGADAVFDVQGKRIGGARLLAVVTLKHGEQGRQYRVAEQRDYEAVWNAQTQVQKLAVEKLPNGLSVIPDERMPAGGGSGAGRAFSVQKYGMMTFGDLFTARQKLALLTYANSVRALDLSIGIKECLALSFSHVVTRNSSLCLWRYQEDQEKVESVFGRQALPIVWDFAEAVPISESTGSFLDSIEIVARAIQFAGSLFIPKGQAQLSDACAFSLARSGLWYSV